MKYKTLIKKLKLTDSDFKSIKDSVASVEAKTTGEIAVALAPESARYCFWELLAADCVGMIVLLCMIPFSQKILELYHRLYWQNEPGWILPVFYIISCLAAVLIAFYIVAYLAGGCWVSYVSY